MSVPVRLALLVLVACGSRVAPTATPPPAVPIARPPVVTAVPNSAIQLIALSADGNSAVTASAHASLRLWPTFDGSREPIVIAGPEPKQLALVHASGFAIAIIDSAGIPTIERYAEDGTVMSRAQLDQTVAQIVATPTGFIALATDGRLLAIDPGNLVPRMVAPPARVIGLAATGKDVLAIVEDQQVTGRWLNADLGFGEATPPLEIRAGTRAFAVAANHSELLGLVRDELEVVSLSTGKRIDGHAAITGAGFIDAYTLVYWNDKGYVWIDDNVDTDLTADGKTIVAAGNKIAFASGVQLGLVTADDNVAYLGYRYPTTDEVRPTPLGDEIVMGSDARFMIKNDVLGDQLGNEGERSSDYVALSKKSHLALIETNSQYALMLDDREVMRDLVASEVHYEPASRLVGQPGLVDFRFLDLETKRTYSVPEPHHGHQVFMTDPDTAHGIVAVVVASDLHDHALAWTLRRRDLEAGTLGTLQTFPATIAAVDRRGTIYLAREGGVEQANANVVFPEGAVDPSPDGELVAIRTDHELQMYTRRGTLRWHLAIDTQWARWSADGTSLWIGNSAIARVDPATGMIVARHCGFQFARRKLPDAAIHENGALFCE